MKFKKQWMMKILIFNLTLTLENCAVDPDPSSSSLGMCRLNCSQAKIAGTDMQIRFVPETLEISCQGETGKDYPGALPLRFLVEKNARILPAQYIPGPSGSSGEEPMASLGSNFIPVGGIGFDISVISGKASSTPNPDDAQFKYQGILTSQNSWCTDSCGVGYVDFLPYCSSENNKIQILVSSGPLEKILDVTLTP